MADRGRDPVHMIREAAPGTSGARVLFVGACGVIVVAGLRAAGSILVPFALALFLAILTLPITVWLQNKRVWSPLAIVVGVLINLAIFGLIVFLGATSASEFQTEYPRYVNRLYSLWFSWVERLQELGFPAGDLVALDFLDPGRVVNLLRSTLQGVASFVSGTFIVVLVLLFTLAEATVFPQKFVAIMGRERGSARRLQKIVHEVQVYLGIKTLVSLATGVLLGVWAWAMGLDFPVMLGVMAFVLNYIPTIGSVLASLPAMLLGLIQYDPVHALLVGTGYVVVNVLFGNIIEPNLMGRRLGLSTLVVLLSLLFWGWVWGPVGMLLAVPLTMVVKIWLENTEDLRWVAILLDKGAPPDLERHPVAPSGAPSQPSPESSSRPISTEPDAA